MVKNDVSERRESGSWPESVCMPSPTCMMPAAHSEAPALSIFIMLLGTNHDEMEPIPYSIMLAIPVTAKRAKFQAESEECEEIRNHCYRRSHPYRERKLSDVGWDDSAWWGFQRGAQVRLGNSHSKSPKTNELRKIKTDAQKLNWFLYCRLLTC